MSLWDKIRCVTCDHWRIWHTGTHIRGSRTACRHPRCGCIAFIDPEITS